MISEIHSQPLFGDNDTEQYVELRGTPNTAIADGTYFVTIEAWGAVPGGAGFIHSAIDLSGLEYGSNGFLVIAQFGNPYSFDEGANVIESDSEGFSGLPDNRWNDETELSDRFAFIGGSESFLIINSSEAPVPGEDIDVDDDGQLDGFAAGWEIIDGVGLLGNTPTPSRSYGLITFTEDLSHQFPDGTTVVEIDRSTYVARIGASEGWEADEWVAGTTINEFGAPPGEFRFTFGTFGDPQPIEYAGRRLADIGTFNFGGGARGQVLFDSNGNLELDEGDTPVPGGIVFADQNSSGTIDNASVTVDTILFDNETELTNLFDNATLTVAREDNSNIGFRVRKQTTPDDNFDDISVFASEGIPFFNTNTRLRVTFYNEANRVRIEAIAASRLTETFGRIEVYDSNDNLLEFAQSAPLLGQARQRLSIARPQADIKYAVIYSNDNIAGSSPFGHFDRLEYSYPEFVAPIDSNGNYAIDELPIGDYTIRPIGVAGIQFVPESGVYDLSVTHSEHILNADFGFRSNAPPAITTSAITVAENPRFGLRVATIEIEDPDLDQTHTFEQLFDAGPFGVDATTGDVIVINGQPWDFETSEPVELIVRVTDSGSPQQSDTATIVISPADINEPPEIEDQTFSLSEFAQAGTNIGTVLATDPDNGLGGELRYSISDVAINQVFRIDDTTGELTLFNSSQIDFETRAVWEIPIRVFDFGRPSRSVSAIARVEITDENEVPEISSQQFAVPELSEPGFIVGTVVANDPDRNQELTFSILGGSGAEFFDISPSGALTTNENTIEFDPEANVLSLEILVADNGVPQLSAAAIIDVTVEDVNLPPAILEDGFEVAEDIQPGSVVGRLSAIGPEEDQSTTISPVTNLSATPFEWNAENNELLLRSDATLDAETTNQFVLEFRVIDTEQPPISSTHSITISVLDVNESPVIESATFTVAENSDSGFLIGEITVTAPDVNDSFSISVDGEFADFFAVNDDNQIVVVESSILDFEETPQIVLPVSVVDAGGLSSSTDITLDLLDLNEAPVVTGVVDGQQILAATTEQFELDLSVFSDPDDGDQLSFALQFVDENGELSDVPEWLVHDSNSNIVSASPFNAQTGVHNLTIVATDAAGLAASVEFAITVDRNATPWRNLQNPLDVDGSGSIRPRDALLIINSINREGVQVIPEDVDFRDFFLDVDGDNNVRPLDALLVINSINRNGVGQGEGEFAYDEFTYDDFGNLLVSTDEQMASDEFDALAAWLAAERDRNRDAE